MRLRHAISSTIQCTCQTHPQPPPTPTHSPAQDSKFSCCTLRSNVPRWGCPKLLGAPKQITQPTPPSFAEETVARLSLIDKKLHNALNAKQVRRLNLQEQTRSCFALNLRAGV